jgi:hypothetical protein
VRVDKIPSNFKMNKYVFLYKNIFLYASLQFCGNIEEYFKNHTKNLVVFIIMPRVKNKFNIIRHYQEGILVKENKVLSSENIFLYYYLWYTQYLRALLYYFPRQDSVAVITFHPLTFLFMIFQKMLRRIEFVYWIGDYFPGINLPLKLYERLKKHYHTHITYACYLSSKINEKMNGSVVKTVNRKTVMWGVKPKFIKRRPMKNQLQILFVGLVKPSQGIESILYFLKTHKDYNIKILGICEAKFYKKLKDDIKKYGITKQVYFPNKFLSDKELEKESQDCHVAVALYDVSPLNATYYADPGKVKSYAEHGLPIVMSNISDSATYIKRFKCGEVIDSIDELEKAFIKIKKNYAVYQNGLEKFNSYFNYESYYKKSFLFLEKLW